jgi:hypothetical protein
MNVKYTHKTIIYDRQAKCILSKRRKTEARKLILYGGGVIGM